MEIGSGTKRVLASKTEDKKKTLRLAFRKCLKTMAIYMKDHLPVNNVVLRDTQWSEKKKQEEQQLAGCVNSQHMRKVTKSPRLTICVTLSVPNGSTMPVTLHWIEQLLSFVTIFVHTVCMYLSNMVDTVGEKKY